MNFFYSFSKDLINYFLVYFTSYPYFIYNKSNNSGNLAFSGIGLGLIQSQQIFWISNGIMMINYYLYFNKNYYYINIFLAGLCTYLYIHSFFTVRYFLKIFTR
jgi:hypothetical protein